MGENVVVVVDGVSLSLNPRDMAVLIEIALALSLYYDGGNVKKLYGQTSHRITYL